MVLTKDKMQTVGLLQKIQSQLGDDQQEGRLGALIDNDDKRFLDALGAPKTNEVVMHYQIIHQIWK